MRTTLYILHLDRKNEVDKLASFDKIDEAIYVKNNLTGLFKEKIFYIVQDEVLLLNPSVEAVQKFVEDYYL